MSQITSIKDVVSLILAVQQKIDHIDEKFEKLLSKIGTPNKKVDHIDEKLEKLLSKIETPNKKVDQIDEKLENFLTQIETPNKKVDQIDEKLEKLSSKIETPNKKVDQIDEKLEKLLTQIETPSNENKFLVIRRGAQTTVKQVAAPKPVISKPLTIIKPSPIPQTSPIRQPLPASQTIPKPLKISQPMTVSKPTTITQPISKPLSTSSMIEEHFAFRPIENQKEALSLTNKLKSDLGFAERFYTFLSSKSNLIIDDLYSPKYLNTQTFTSLKQSLIFEDFFMRVKKNKGCREDEIEISVSARMRAIKKAYKDYEKNKREKFLQRKDVVKVHKNAGISYVVMEAESDEEMEEMDFEEDNGMSELEPGEIPIKIEEPDSPDPSFIFTPIENDEELKQISKKIRQDSMYKTQLRRFIKKIGDFKVTDLFLDTFLLSLLEGKNELHTLQTLEPFEQIYVFLKFTRGEGSQDKIRQSALAEINEIRERLSAHEETLDIPMDTVRVKLEDEPSTSSSSHPEIIITEQQINKNFDLYQNDASTFVPIRNEDDLEKLTKKLSTNIKFVKDLQKKLKDEVADGHVKLEQIFSVEFLREYGVFDNGQAKLEELKAYKILFVACNKQQGCATKEIKDATERNLKQLYDDQPKKIIGYLRKRK